MTRRFSPGLADMLNNRVPAVGGADIAGTTIAAVSSTTDSFTDTGEGFIDAGFIAGDIIMVSGFLAAANNGIFTVASVEAGTLGVVETTITGESAGPNVKIQCIKGGSLADIFKDGVLYLYTGTQPASASYASTSSTLLAIFTNNGGTFVPGSPENGLRFGVSSLGVMSKDASQVWQSVAIASGTAGWFRLCANPADSGALSTSLPRIDGSVGTSGSQLDMTSTTITLGATYTIDTFTITLALS